MFRHADKDKYISLRAFHDVKDHEPPLFIEGVKVGAPDLLDRFCARITQAATASEPYVFCPPVCTFNNPDSAKLADLAEGVALSVECDANPRAAYNKLVAILGTPTATVASGGTWLNGDGKLEPKLHLHWRLIEPTRTPEAHERLRRLRVLAARLVGADTSNITIVHPIRSPGSWHRKNADRPVLTRVKVEPDREIDLADALERLQAACPEPERPKARTNGSPPGSDDEQRARDAIEYIPANDRETWLRMGMALHSTGWPSGFAIWDDWAGRSDKYNERDQEKTWRSFRDRSNGVTIGTLFHEALQYGYDPRGGHRTPLGGRARGLSGVTGAHLISQCAADIDPKPVDFLWSGRLARGKHTAIAGEPGDGKSQLSVYVAATISRGGEWPCGEGRAPICNVIILSAEDSADDTVVPRLMAAGADLSRVHIVSAVTQEDGKGRRAFNLQADLALLEQKIADIGDVALVIIDPISSYMGKADSHKNADVRGALEPASEMAARLRVGILSITHFSKTGSGNTSKALHRFIGSIAFVGAPRAAFAVIADAENEGRILFLHAKNNLARRPQGLAYRLVQTDIGKSGHCLIASYVVWDNAPVDMSADEALRANDEGGERGAATEAEDYLRDILAAGPIPAKEGEAGARAHGIATRTLARARKRLGVVAEKGGMQEGWTWRLPPEGCQKNPKDAKSGDGSLRPVWHSSGSPISHPDGEGTSCKSSFRTTTATYSKKSYRT
jgi:putative DNA primase/helicase